ncbi:SDR family oxidoreductase [Cryobacterium sp. TMT1-21]|uniref:SDR family oxidoreductase n=1 Tax=Cryobacterium shii TaxID=1259235 RepID=A0AAQ2C3Z3_9MICO|nr:MULTISPECIES: SDR family oxidoreductase [Cryobacterium]TFC42488.1 SDR family oxidoreductase [Cryobacterium shii]TFC80820.1 SDR family oxidoreductase [Cryobacterium sp. TmT2-59]TFD13252.1 SDR family oxidoreductase [Cryobacterium sp. TMT1-21]TFD18673.1 SDR family oxidoreductase [Cryobacterium sp. TMT4-10]TFD28475.1 SDR family oxidoreductase [Cryobacterium sp. TMT2-23]
MKRTIFNPIGTTALVTGASSGLGRGFARELAERGADLVLTARRQDRLEELAVELAEKYGTVSTVIPLDLARPGAVTELVADLHSRDITVGTLVNNAGFGSWGDVRDSDADRAHEQVALNVQALTDLTHALLPDLLRTLRERPGSAALVNMASTAAFQPVPHMAVYGATKAFVLRFTEALWAETRAGGLKVTALCPGPVATEFAGIAGNVHRFRRVLTVDDVMRTAFDALDLADPPPYVVSGRRNAVLARIVGVLPHRFSLGLVGRLSALGHRRPGR